MILPEIVLIGSVEPPYRTDCFDAYPADCPDPGFDVATLYHVLTAGGFRVRFKKAPSYEEVFQAIINGSADGLARFYLFSDSEVKQYNLSSAEGIAGETLAFMYPNKGNVSPFQEGLFLSALGWKAGLILVITGLIAALVGHLKRIFPDRANRRLRSVETLSFALWAVFLSVILSLYSSMLGIYLFKPRTVAKQPFKTLDELADKLINGEIHLFTIPYWVGTFKFFAPIKNNISSLDWSNPELLEKFRRAEAMNLTTLYKEEEVDIAPFLAPGKWTWPVVITESLNAYLTEWLHYPKIKTIVFDGIHSPSLRFYYKPKTRGMVESINRAFAAHVDMIYQYYAKKDALKVHDTAPIGDHRTKHSEHETRVDPLSLFQLIDTVWILVLGATLASICFLLEKIMFWKNRFKTWGMDKLKLLIDCDCGVDDAEAIMMALGYRPLEELQILGITCVAGNTTLNNAATNVLRVLKTCKREEIQVFKGASVPLLGFTDNKGTSVHGQDGFGGITHTILVDESMLQREQAAVALVRIIKEHPQEVTLVTLGPLTNVALALRLCPELASLVKQLVILGGGQGKYDDHTTAEFNISADPEAAAIVFCEFTCPITFVPFETCLRTTLSWEWHTKWLSSNSSKAAFLQKLDYDRATMLKSFHLNENGYYACDPYAMAVALYQNVVEEQLLLGVDMNFFGPLIRGQTVVDWGDRIREVNKVRIVTKMNVNILKLAFENMIL